jgi:protein TonB
MGEAMEKATGSKSLTVAALVSLIIHGGIFLAYAVVFKDAGASTAGEPLQVALILPNELGKSAPSPVTLAMNEKARFRKEDPGEAGMLEDLARSLETAPPQAGRETPATKAAPEAAVPSAANQEAKNPATPSPTDQNFRPGFEAGTLAALGKISASLSDAGAATGKTTENGTNSMGKQDVVASRSRGEASSSGYTQLETSRSGGLTVAVPRYRDNYLPDYPLPARRRGYAGVVMLSVEVLADGNVGRLEMKKTSGYDLLDKSARETVKGWKFSPAKKMGAPITMWVDVPVKFELN